MATGTFSDDFEDGNIDGWEGNPEREISTTAIKGDFSLYSESDLQGGSRGITTWEAGPELDLQEEFEIYCVFRQHRVSGNRTDLHARLGIEGDSSEEGENVFLNFNEPDGVTFLATWENEETPSPTTDNAIGESFDDQWVELRIFSAEESDSVQAKVWGYGSEEPEEYQMERMFSGVSGAFVIHIGNDSDNIREAWLDEVRIFGIGVDASAFVFERGRNALIEEESQDLVFDGPSRTAILANEDSELAFIQDVGVGVGE